MLKKLKEMENLDKEEEYFKMCVVSQQLCNIKNKKIMSLNPSVLLKDVRKANLPFFKWNKWLMDHIEKITFEEMY